MTQVNLEEAQLQLRELLQAAGAGEEVVIRENGHAFKIVPLPDEAPRPRFGSAKGMIAHMADDFDAPLEEMKEYSE